MSELIRWVLVLELVGLACLPITLRLFRWLPDRGYAFSKLLGLLLLTFVIWLIGSAFPIVGSPLAPAAVVLAVGVGVWIRWGRDTLDSLRNVAKVATAEECLFLVALGLWTLMRATVFHPGIGHTEQYMDLTFLQGSLRSASYPPYDAWMSGHSINYYYFGYLMYATLTKLTGISPTVSYNLALSTVFAFTIVGAYSVIHALTRSYVWSLAGPLFVGLLGNWHALLVQIPAGLDPNSTNWFWDSTRVIGTHFVNGTIPSNFNPPTINEFPYFSFMLGDLHPHVMALPVTIMAIALGVALVKSPTTIRLSRDPAVLARLALIGICTGSLYAINSWDFPTYLILIAACLAANAYLTDETTAWWQAPLFTIPAVAIVSVLAFLPFYITYKSPAHGFGLVTTPSDIGQFLQVFGLFLLAAAILLVTFGVILQPTEEAPAEVDSEAAGRSRSALEAGAGRSGDSFLVLVAIAVVLFVFGLRFHQWTFVLLLAFVGAALLLLQRVMNTEEPNRSDTVALLLVALGCAVLAGTEVIYLKDQFDGGSNYRMNTVFKFYYQGWTLLGLAAAYTGYRAFGLLRRHFGLLPPILAIGAIGVGVCAAGIYTVGAPQSANWGGTAVSLDGMSALTTNPTCGADAAAINWMRSHVNGNPVELEAGNGGDYDPCYGRVAAFTGLPTVMGWSGHEYQWRGNDPEIQQRVSDVTTIYATTNDALATRLLRKYNVRYVFAGTSERLIPGAHLNKFRQFMHVAFQHAGTTVYTW